LIGEALDQTMTEIETRMETKVRKGYQQENRASPNMIYAKYCPCSFLAFAQSNCKTARS